VLDTLTKRSGMSASKDDANLTPRLRTERTMAVTLGSIRIAQHLPFIAVTIGGWTAYTQPSLVGALFAVSFAWSLFLFGRAYRRGGVRASWVFVDLAFYAVAAIVVARCCLPGHDMTWDNWSVGPLIGAGASAAVYLSPRIAASSVAVLAVAYVVGIQPDAHEPGDIALTVGNLASMLFFPFAAGLAAATVRRSARETEEATQREYQLRVERETERLLVEERVRQYSLLHDTVLSTLSAIARGGLDHRSAEVQKRCADDADLLRGLISGMANDTPTSLAAALAEVSRAHADLGLEVRQQYGDLPDALPPEVVEAIAHAVREALNNVVKYAGTTDVWITATGDETGAVRVTVTDRGAGFDTRASRGGFGINQSIKGRMKAAGGRGRVHSWIGDGTEVELEWPKP